MVYLNRYRHLTPPARRLDSLYSRDYQGPNHPSTRMVPHQTARTQAVGHSYYQGNGKVPLKFEFPTQIKPSAQSTKPDNVHAPRIWLKNALAQKNRDQRPSLYPVLIENTSGHLAKNVWKTIFTEDNKSYSFISFDWDDQRVAFDQSLTRSLGKKHFLNILFGVLTQCEDQDLFLPDNLLIRVEAGLSHIVELHDGQLIISQEFLDHAQNISPHPDLEESERLRAILRIFEISLYNEMLKLMGVHNLERQDKLLSMVYEIFTTRTVYGITKDFAVYEDILDWDDNFTSALELYYRQQQASDTAPNNQPLKSWSDYSTKTLEQIRLEFFKQGFILDIPWDELIQKIHEEDIGEALYRMLQALESLPKTWSFKRSKPLIIRLKYDPQAGHNGAFFFDRHDFYSKADSIELNILNPFKIGATLRHEIAHLAWEMKLRIQISDIMSALDTYLLTISGGNNNISNNFLSSHYAHELIAYFYQSNSLSNFLEFLERKARDKGIVLNIDYNIGPAELALQEAVQAVVDEIFS